MGKQDLHEEGLLLQTTVQRIAVARIEDYG